MHDHLGRGVAAVRKDGLYQRGGVQVGGAECDPGYAACQQSDGETCQYKDWGRAYCDPPSSSAMTSTASAIRGP